MGNLDLNNSIILGLSTDKEILIHCSDGEEFQTPLVASLFVSKKGREKAHQIIEILTQAIETVELLKESSRRGNQLN